MWKKKKDETGAYYVDINTRATRRDKPTRDWIVKKDAKGKKYYQNAETGVKTTTKPL